MSDTPYSRFAIVTGGNGWLGKRLIKALISGVPETHGELNGNWRVRCLVPAEEKAEELAACGVEIIRGDIRSAQARQALLKGADGATLFHLAGVIHPPGFTSAFEDINHRAAIALINEAGHLRRAVVMSSNSPLGCNPSPLHVFDEESPYNPYMGYGRSKMRLEQHLRLIIKNHQPPEITIIRAPWFYGPGQPPRQTLFFRMIREGKMPIFGNGLNRRSMAYTDSLALGLVLAAVKSGTAGEIFWIADKRPYPMEEIISTVADVLKNDFGKSIATAAPRLPGIIPDVARVADAALQGAGLYHQKIHVLSEMNQTIACSIAKAERVLGYRPLVELREGMRRSIQWCLENGMEI